LPDAERRGSRMAEEDVRRMGARRQAGATPEGEAAMSAERRAASLREVDAAGREPGDLKAMYDGLLFELYDAARGCPDPTKKATASREFRALSRDRATVVDRLYPAPKGFTWSD
jgi:hypothetical protein